MAGTRDHVRKFGWDQGQMEKRGWDQGTWLPPIQSLRITHITGIIVFVFRDRKHFRHTAITLMMYIYNLRDECGY